MILLPTDSNKLLMQWKGPYTVEIRVGANDYRIKMGSKTKTYHLNIMLKKYFAREPEVDVVHTNNKDDATIAVARVIYQDTNSELGEVPDFEGYHQKEGIQDVKLGEDLSEDKRHMLKDLIRRYPGVGLFTDMPGETDVIQHRVKLTDDTPICCKPYPLPYALREELQNNVDSMLEMAVVRPSTSPYVSPIIMVKKKDGSNRVCVDSGATLVRGLKKILKGLSGVGSYINDIVIYSDSWEEHLRTMKELFGSLRRARITARPTKCLLGANRMEFLGHQIGGDVITPSNENLKVQKTPCPTTKKQVRSFLGLVGYYRDHIPTFAEISAPPSDLLKKRMPEQVQWNEAQESAYSLFKEYLLQEPVLKHPDLMKPFILRTDASGNGVAALLLQENEGKLYPVGYASKKVEPSIS